MAWWDDVAGAVGSAVTKHVVPAVANYGGAVVGAAAGTVVGGPAGTVAGFAAGKAATAAIKGIGRAGDKALRKKKRVPAKRVPEKVRAAVKKYGRVRVRNKRTGRTVTVSRAPSAAAMARAKAAGDARRRASKKAIRRQAKKRAAAKRRAMLARRSVAVKKLKLARKRRALMARKKRTKRRRKGIPAMVVPSGSQKGDALATAGRLIASIQSADPKLKAYAKAVMNATAKRARAGDTAAQRAVSFLKTAQSANKSKGRLPGFLVTNSGRVVIGSFLQTG